MSNTMSTGTLFRRTCIRVGSLDWSSRVKIWYVQSILSCVTSLVTNMFLRVFCDGIDVSWTLLSALYTQAKWRFFSAEATFSFLVMTHSCKVVASTPIARNFTLVFARTRRHLCRRLPVFFTVTVQNRAAVWVFSFQILVVSFGNFISNFLPSRLVTFSESYRDWHRRQVYLKASLTEMYRSCSVQLVHEGWQCRPLQFLQALNYECWTRNAEQSARTMAHTGNTPWPDHTAQQRSW